MLVGSADPAGATVTIGSADPFGPAPTGLVSCTTPPCSFSQAALPGRPVTSPVHGVVIRWSVRWGATPDTAALRVLDPFGGEALFVSSTGPETIVADKQSFAASLPIDRGDRIAVDDLAAGLGGPRGNATNVPGAVIDTWLDSPANGGFAAPSVSNNPPDTELLLNAEIEPSNDIRFDAFTKNRRKGTAMAFLSLPNPGTLAVSSRLVVQKRAGRRFGELLLAPTKKTRKRLNRTGKAVGAATFIFTPIFGTANAETARVVLRLKR
jgi:hypothetical protein